MDRSKRYNIVYADPPWSYEGKSLWDRGGASDHYSTQSVEWIASLPIEKIAAWDCACFMWATFPKLVEALYVMRAWGFEYKTVAFTWVKTNAKSGTPFFGMGQWTRSNAEICLLGIRGSIARQSKSVPQIIMAPISDHSSKPEQARDRIVELMGDLPRVELFARQRMPLWPTGDGWETWGNELAPDVDLIGRCASGVKASDTRACDAAQQGEQP